MNLLVAKIRMQIRQCPRNNRLSTYRAASATRLSTEYRHRYIASERPSPRKRRTCVRAPLSPHRARLSHHLFADSSRRYLLAAPCKRRDRSAAAHFFVERRYSTSWNCRTVLGRLVFTPPRLIVPLPETVNEAATISAPRMSLPTPLGPVIETGALAP